MRALTTLSTLSGVSSSYYTNYPRCFTEADSSTPASDTRIFYNSGAATGDCGYAGGYVRPGNCACKCHHPPPSPPLSPPPPSPSSPPPYAPLAWTTFSSGADCEANGCITPSSQAECEDAMRALTTRSTLTFVSWEDLPRCFTQADSSTAASDTANYIYYNSVATTGPCENTKNYNCACKCHHPPASPPPPPYAPLAWTTFSSGADCEANGCVAPSSQAECEDAMRALTTLSTLSGVGSYPGFPRCVTSSPAVSSTSSVYYNTGTTTGDCGTSGGWNCACKCHHPPASPPPSPPPLPPSLPPPPSPPWVPPGYCDVCPSATCSCGVPSCVPAGTPLIPTCPGDEGVPPASPSS